jgi:uncharacterized repeat protein (TIGR03803 family)
VKGFDGGVEVSVGGGFMRRLLKGETMAAVVLAVVLGSASGAQAQTNFMALKRLTLATGFVAYGRLMLGPDGVLYGTGAGGGVSNAGAIFRINPDGSGFVTLRSFTGPDGGGPQSGLAFGTNGFLFGATYGGGISNFGVIFKIGTNGSGFQVLHHFTGSTDGKNPSADPIIASDGAVYGVTYYADGATRGTVYKINQDGSGYQVIHTFTGTPDGQQPTARLLQASDGMLYGTTVFGGISSQLGTIYRLNLGGGGYQVVHALQSSSGEGRNLQAGLCQSANGLLYGTVYVGGSANVGGIFKMDTEGVSYSLFRSFQTSGGDGQNPNTDLVEGPDGYLYGGTYAGGVSGGTLFKVKNDNSDYAILRSFATTGNDFYTPNAPLIRSNGVLYGTTRYGGGGAAGCVYALTASPMPPRTLLLTTSPGSNFVQFAATSFTRYEVQRSTNLSTWSVLSVTNAPANGNLTYSDLNPSKPSGFYRLHQQ